jgi:hypothetical protein
MKKFLMILMVGVFLSSCEQQGVTRVRLNGNENELPGELKGLKVYSVSIGGGSYVKVAVIGDQVNSVTHHENKQDKTTIIVDKRKQRVIEIENILTENDSIIVCRKK